jgi:hypothetical protein
MRNLIYNLKRQFGEWVTLVYVSSSNIDYETGSTTETRSSLRIKAIVLRGFGKRDFIQDLAYIAAGKNFTSGGRFDVDMVSILIAQSDAVSFEPMLTKYFVLDNKRYNVYDVKSVQNAYELKGEALRNERPGEIHTTTKTTIMTMSTS